jgi:hypothetical protein
MKINIESPRHFGGLLFLRFNLLLAAHSYFTSAITLVAEFRLLNSAVKLAWHLSKELLLGFNLLINPRLEFN